MLVRTIALLAIISSPVLAHSEEDLEHMGPLGMMWPPDRAWSEQKGRTAPCGSADGPGSRTDFPLSGGSLSLEQKEEAYDVEVSISFSENPATNEDFITIVPASHIRSLDMSHYCFDMPSLPSSAVAGLNATLQLRYTAEYIDPNHTHKFKRHTAENQTFYACSDITFVEPAVFTYTIPCFNVTADAHAGESGETGEEHEHSHENNETSSESTEGQSRASGSSGSSGLSKEAIAGVVIGCVVGVGIVASLGFYLYRRDRREKQVAQQIMAAGEK
ncbi:hypothetical protein jhhlp_008112 [Lomentospora prolificans]|uniref:Copper acquisition factor BIM1-like domain-containing protein n=1 Tax=Lomentospora prolificans TaxID=41688 RepID=A0A2N3MZH8_9PEZI|nr:hypothetical protein jhhlp_008112 [Lomentospora prolificans]